MKISLKVGILYFFLALLNIAFFTIMIFENQMDLIIENVKFKTEKTANTIYSRINSVEQNNPDQSTAEQALQQLDNELSPMLVSFMIFDEKGQVLLKKEMGKTEEAGDYHLRNGLNAQANRETLGNLYYSIADENKYTVDFYIPFNHPQLKETIVYFNMEMKEIKEKKNTLYLLVLIVIAVILLFHLIFAVFLSFVLIRPLKRLADASFEISHGNLEARVPLKSRDEFGQVASTFNSMASSVQETIAELNKQNEIMRMELEMAGRVQEGIYPVLRQTDFLDIAVYHKPLMEVSGDFHDIVELPNNCYGILIADVSGHGVAAALITIMIKDAFRGYASSSGAPSKLMKYLNSELADLMDKYGKFFTAFYMVVDPGGQRVLYTNAGHHLLLLCRPSENKIYGLDSKGIVIGISPEMNNLFQSKSTRIQSGDKLIMITDGIVEAVNKEGIDYKTEGLLRSIKSHLNEPAEIILDSIMNDFYTFVGESALKDDCTVIVTEIK